MTAAHRHQLCLDRYQIYWVCMYCVLLFGLGKPPQLFQEAAKTLQTYPPALQFSSGNWDENKMPYPIFVLSGTIKSKLNIRIINFILLWLRDVMDWKE